jgi:hypothetical protein
MSFELVESSSYFSKAVTVEPSGLSGDSAPADTAKDSSFQEVLSLPDRTEVLSLPKEEKDGDTDGSNRSFPEEQGLYTEILAGYDSGCETDGGEQRQLENKGSAFERKNRKETKNPDNVFLDYEVLDLNLGGAGK